MKAKEFDKILFRISAANRYDYSYGLNHFLDSKENFSNYAAIATNILKRKDLKYIGSLNETPSEIKINKKRRCKLFSCDFLPNSCYFNHLQWRKKLNPNALNFIMYVDTIKELKKTDTKLCLEYDHIENAFSYIRYYIEEKNVVVIEIQSDIFGQLPNKIKTSYANWYRLLLLAFQEYVRFLKTNSIIEIESIFIVDSQYIKRRFDEINNNLAKRIYEELPKFMGYVKCDSIPFAFEPSHSPKTIRTGWHKNLINIHPTDLLESEFQYIYIQKVIDRL